MKPGNANTKVEKLRIFDTSGEHNLHGKGSLWKDEEAGCSSPGDHLTFKSVHFCFLLIVSVNDTSNNQMQC